MPPRSSVREANAMFNLQKQQRRPLNFFQVQVRGVGVAWPRTQRGRKRNLLACTLFFVPPL